MWTCFLRFLLNMKWNLRNIIVSYIYEANVEIRNFYFEKSSKKVKAEEKESENPLEIKKKLD